MCTRIARDSMIISGYHVCIALFLGNVPRKELSEPFRIKYFNTGNFSQYFSQILFGIQVIELAVYVSDNATALACAPSNVDEDNQFFLPIILSLTERATLLLDNSKCPFSKRIFLSWLRTYFLAFPSDDRTFVYCLMIFNKLQSYRYKFHLFANL